jgi:hypothetical protein
MTTRLRECDPLVSAARATRIARAALPERPGGNARPGSGRRWVSRDASCTPRCSAFAATRPPTANTSKPPKVDL